MTIDDLDEVAFCIISKRKITPEQKRKARLYVVQAQTMCGTPTGEIFQLLEMLDLVPNDEPEE